MYESISNYLSGFVDRVGEYLWHFPLGVTREIDLLNWKWVLVNLISVVALSFVLSRGFRKPLRKLRAHLGSRRMRKELKVDLKFFLFKIAYQPFKIALFGPIIVLISLAFRDITVDSFQVLSSAPPISIGGVGGALFKVFFVVVFADFSNFIFHYFSHRLKPLWHLHAVHHRATYLTPLLKYRVHPFELLGANFVDATFKGIGLGVLGVFVHSGSMPFFDQYLLAFLFVGKLGLGHIRHSHFWISYGPIMSYVFVSPAMHQIHHSKDPKHIGKNLGVILSVWDYMFGTLYIPKKKERLVFGLSGQTRNESVGLRGELVTPAVLCYRELVSSSMSLAKTKTLPELPALGVTQKS